MVRYDRRGNSRSTLDGPPGPQLIPDHADDAIRLVEHLGGVVFGDVRLEGAA